MAEQVRHLLVDGNNIGRAWPETALLWRRQIALGQQRLIDQVRGWHDGMGWRVTVVFDGRGPELVVDQPTGEASWLVVHAPRGVTADTVIEQWVGRSRDAADCVVATDDRALVETVAAQGAGTISSRDLRAWLDRAQEAVSRQVRRTNGDGKRPPGSGAFRKGRR